MNQPSLPPLSEFLALCHSFDPGEDQPRPLPAGWSFVRALVEALERHDRLLVVKSRQMLVTWVGCACLLHRALSSGPGVHLVLSKEERSAKELIERIRFLYDHLPEGLRGEPVKLLSGTVSFPERGARILSLPAAPHAVRGLSPRTVFWDEMAFTPHDEEIWAAVKPAVDAGGRFLGVSTPNGPAGVFSRLVHGGEGRFTVHRIHYRQHPARDAVWERSARSGLSAARWRREQELSFEGAEGRVYDQFEPGLHLLDAPYLPRLEPGTVLYRGIDFGYLHPAVVWAEEHPDGGLIVFDCLVGDRLPLGDLVGEIRRVDARYGLGEADFAWTAVDPAGEANMDIGISPVEGLEAAGIKVVARRSSISAGVEAVRALLLDAAGRVRLRVDRRCRALIEGFHAYAWAEDGETPKKDGVHDHPMDALRYLVVNLPRHTAPPALPLPKVGGMPTR